MLPLNVPFLPDADYVRFLAGLGADISAVHFGLYDASLSDARVRLRTLAVDALVDLLLQLPGPKKYLLANGRFHTGETYRGGERLERLIDRLTRLAGAGVVDGLIFADSYLLTALGDAAPSLAARLEAVPSVNFGIDAVEKAEVLLNLADACGFRPPGKLPLDRGLNRRPEGLAALTRGLRERWPAMQVELLANEGCLSHCPFRSTHEALIAAANAGLAVDTHRLNRDLACLRILNRAPHRILASPFIRPEDIGRYEEVADLIKVCGRTLGGGFLKRTVEAYAAGRYDGNLFDLLDASHWMAERWELPNSELPADLFTMLSGCDQLCGTCGACEEIFGRHARLRPLGLRDLRAAGEGGEEGA
jgi:collagenase-like PrtC family protease